MKKTIYLFLLFAALSVSQVYAQFGVRYRFSDMGQNVGVSYTLKNKFDFNVSIIGVSHFEDISPEFTATVTILNKDSYKLFAGVGVITNRFYSIVAPVGIQVTPFTTVSKLSFTFEVNAMFGLDGNPDAFVPLFGVAYTLW